MASVISLLYFFYQTGIVANNIYSFYSFTNLVYPHLKKYGNKIPYDDLETVYNNIYKVYSEQVNMLVLNKLPNKKSFKSKFINIYNSWSNSEFESKVKKNITDDSDLWVDLYTQKLVSEKF